MAQHETCPHCGKPVKGKRVMTNPPMVEVALGIAKVEHYHPACYERKRI